MHISLRKRFVVYCLTAWLPCWCYARTWINPQPERPISYVYAPGILASEAHLARYCPSFTASTGEHVTCCKGIEVIQEPVSTGNLPEIELRPPQKRSIASTIVQTLWHPYKSMCYALSYMANHWLGISITSKTDTQDSLHMYAINVSKINLGQEADIALFKKIYDTHITTMNKRTATFDHGVVMYGTSRGSAAAFNFIALHKPAHVQALVCEGLFDSIENVARAPVSLTVRIRLYLLGMTNFRKNGLAPIKLIEHFPKDMPLLLITSCKDGTVPCQCTKNMYRLLRASGHNKVHLLVLKEVAHVWYPYAGKEDREQYEGVVHAFYKHYRLPHIPEFAAAGKQFFMTKTQPESV
jgi:hypothetical protein